VRAIRKYEHGGKHGSPLLSLLQRQRDRVNAREAARKSEAITPIFSFGEDVDYNTEGGPVSYADPERNVMFYKRSDSAGSPYSFKVKTSKKGYTDFSNLSALESALNDPGMFQEEGLREQAIAQVHKSFPMTVDRENQTISFDLSPSEKRELSRAPNWKKNEYKPMTSQDVFRSFMFELTPDEASKFRKTKYNVIKNRGKSSETQEGFAGEGKEVCEACKESFWSS
tara:strand:- start:3873 stop:4550 length:678 start_codon:yes stop_codon:yes gene_type:complete